MNLKAFQQSPGVYLQFLLWDQMIQKDQEDPGHPSLPVHLGVQ